ncbi:MAG: dihydrodipicolinate reductase C-terminal domain-containing protein [Bacteroidota bacterium]
MKIALLGYGKMGKAIEQLALAAGHEIGLRIDASNTHELTLDGLRGHDVAIEFSRPDTAFDNIILSLEAGLPIISGTTAWLDRLEEVYNHCEAKQGAFLYASNFSLGVNLFFVLNQRLAELMRQYPSYAIRVEEEHHTEKLDAPSGTAITLAEGLLPILPNKTDWSHPPRSGDETIPILAERIPDVPGTHRIIYENEIDSIQIQHLAKSREGFARGALMAAEWIVGKQGIFSMKDVLGV